MSQLEPFLVTMETRASTPLGKTLWQVRSQSLAVRGEQFHISARK